MCLLIRTTTSPHTYMSFKREYKWNDTRFKLQSMCSQASILHEDDGDARSASHCCSALSYLGYTRLVLQ